MIVQIDEYIHAYLLDLEGNFNENKENEKGEGNVSLRKRAEDS